jgi:deoxycytidylate deaminase
MLSNYKSLKAYPYMPPGCEIVYVKDDNPFIQAAKKVALESGCVKQSTGAVIVIDNQIVAQGSNAGLRVEVCPRVVEKCATGKGYHHCKETCKQDGHAEEQTAKDFQRKALSSEGAEMFLWGHWWCCEPCWDWIKKIGLTKVHLLEGATEMFDLDASK